MVSSVGFVGCSGRGAFAPTLIVLLATVASGCGQVSIDTSASDSDARFGLPDAADGGFDAGTDAAGDVGTSGLDASDTELSDVGSGADGDQDSVAVADVDDAGAPDSDPPDADAPDTDAPDTDSPDADAATDAEPSCVPTGNELCNGKDDCDGVTATRNGTHKGLHILGNHFEGIVGMPSIKLRNGAGWADLLIANNRFVVPAGQSAFEFYGSNTLVGDAAFVFNSALLLGAGQVVKGSLAAGTLALRNNAAVSLGKASLVSGTPVGPLGPSCLDGVNPATSPAANPADVVGKVAFVSTTKPYDLHLQPSSVCSDKGVPLPAITEDMDGQPRGSPPDIGADELWPGADQGRGTARGPCVRPQLVPGWAKPLRVMAPHCWLPRT